MKEEMDREVLTTGRTYPWSFVTQIFLVSLNPLSRKSRSEPQALEYRINWEIYTVYI